MSYKIIGDSCTDLTQELVADFKLQTIPLVVEIDDYRVSDDEFFDQAEFIKRVKDSDNCPKSACPSPEAFMNACECDAKDIFIITLSSHLSGSYNSARMGIEMFKEEYGENAKNILLIDSESASAGQLSLVKRIIQLYEKGLNFETVCKKILEIRDMQLTYFIIDSLEPLRKNGRLTGLKALIAETLNIKPIMGGDHGVIVKFGQARGLRRAYKKMVDYAWEECRDFSRKALTIAHCNCPDRAQQVKEFFCDKGTFESITITETRGVSTLYAGDGGVIVSIC